MHYPLLYFGIKKKTPDTNKPIIPLQLKLIQNLVPLFNDREGKFGT